MHAAVVELDALADAVRAAAQHHDLLLVGRLGLALVLVGRVHVGGVGRELGGAGVHALVHRAHAQGAALVAHRPCRWSSAGAPGGGRRSPCCLSVRSVGSSMSSSVVVSSSSSIFDDLLDLHQEPRVDLGQVDTPRPRVKPCAKASPTYQMRSGPGSPSSFSSTSRSLRLLVHAVDADFQAAQGLLERFLEGAADGHHLAHRLHLRGQAVVGLREFLEREARDLGDHVVDAAARTMPGVAPPVISLRSSSSV